MADIQAHFNFSSREPMKALFQINPRSGIVYTAGDGISIEDTTISNTRTVNNSTITIKQGETVKGSFTLNQGTDSTIELDAGGTSSVSFANITGQPTDNTNLATALNNKQNILTAGNNIQISNNTISATDTTYTAGNNIQISNNTISATDTTYTAGTGISIENNVISNTQTSAEWGNITGTLSNQTDLQTALNGKQPTGDYATNTALTQGLATKQNTLTAGNNIQINNNTISATDTTYTAGTGISIENNVISNTQTSAEWGNITGTITNQTDLINLIENSKSKITYW